MPGGAFNTAQLIRELGLKPVGPDEMRLRTDIQPVLITGDLSDSTPSHEQPAALFGASLAGAVATVGMFELQCLAPGGGFVDFITYRSGAANALIRVVTAGSGVATILASAGQLSRRTVLSIVRTGAVAPTGNPALDLGIPATQRTVGLLSIYVPVGAFFQMELDTVNVTSDVGIHWRELPAAENVPA